MKKTFTLLLLFISVHLFGQDEKPMIALLGTFHFAGSSDLLSMQFDDFTSEKRQGEIKSMVEALKAYQPTKVILEYPYGNTRLDSMYQEYLKGNHKLTINERQQVGFRIAKAMEHDQIHVADHRQNLPFGEMVEFLKAEGRMAEFEQLMSETRENVIVKMEEYLTNHTVSEFFVFLNDDWSDNANKNAYLDKFSRYTSDENDIGIRVVSIWWERNFRIMGNIDKIAEPGDRLLIIFGQGHTSILKDFYRNREDFEYVEITDYLK